MGLMRRQGNAEARLSIHGENRIALFTGKGEYVLVMPLRDSQKGRADAAYSAWKAERAENAARPAAAPADTQLSKSVDSEKIDRSWPRGAGRSTGGARHAGQGAPAGQESRNQPPPASRKPKVGNRRQSIPPPPSRTRGKPPTRQTGRKIPGSRSTRAASATS
jgi:hypothetical protein